LSSLDKEGLKGARVGVVRQLFAGPESDPDVLNLLEQALADMKRKGAEIVEGVNIAEIDQIPPSKLACDRFKYDINMYLARLGPQAPKSLDDIIASQKFHPSILKYLLDSKAEAPPDLNPQCQTAAVNRLRLARGLLKTMDDARARCAGLSDLEQPAAIDRRPQHPARE
jgi:amidase